VVRIVNEGERVKHLKEKHEGRHEHALGKTLAAQFHHQRIENETFLFGARDQRRERTGRKRDISIGQEQINRSIWRATGDGMFDTLILRPQFAGPASRERPARNNIQAVGRTERRLARDARGTVAALVVDQDHIEGAPVILAQQRGDGLADSLGFIARRHHGGHGRPLRHRGRYGRGGATVVAFGRAPKSAAGRDEIEPGRQHDGRYNVLRHKWPLSPAGL
jgi:hypothetical protein